MNIDPLTGRFFRLVFAPLSNFFLIRVGSHTS